MNQHYDIALSFATEEQELVEKVYRYLKAENILVFFAPALECQVVLSGKNQREVFYEIFGLRADYVALFVSKNYIIKKVTMEEAGIAFAKRGSEGKVVPIYLDGTSLPIKLFKPENDNYYASDDAAVIAAHLALKIKSTAGETQKGVLPKQVEHVMEVSGNQAEKIVSIQNVEGNVDLKL